MSHRGIHLAEIIHEWATRTYGLHFDVAYGADRAERNIAPKQVRERWFYGPDADRLAAHDRRLTPAGREAVRS